MPNWACSRKTPILDCTVVLFYAIFLLLFMVFFCMQTWQYDIWIWGRKSQGIQWWYWNSVLITNVEKSPCGEVALVLSV